MSDVIAAYEKHKNLKLAAEELGMNWQTLYVQLRKLGVAVTGDKSRYGSDRDKLAVRGELTFAEYVPKAVSANEAKFQAKVDFIVGKTSVDVKAAKLGQGNKRFSARRWSFSIKKQRLEADFFVCFAFADDGTCRTLLIPGELVRDLQTISISEFGKSKWWQYEVRASDLAAFFDALDA